MKSKALASRRLNGVSRCSSLSFLTLPLLIIFHLSCTVREDRDMCPCVLELVFAERDSTMLRDGVLVRVITETEKNETIVQQDTIRIRGDLSYKMSVAKGVSRIMCAWPISSVSPDWAKPIIVSNGRECPKLWSSHITADTGKDAAIVDASLHKNFCTIDLRLRGNKDFRLEARGKICGYGMEGELIEGSYSAQMRKDDESTMADWTVRVPRQHDNSLKLDIFPSDDIARTFSIGNFIEQSGYDWTSPDLKDIRLEIDYTVTYVSFTIDNWSKTFHFRTEI